MSEDSKTDGPQYFHAAIRNLSLGSYQFDSKGMLVVSSLAEAEKVNKLLDAFGIGVTGAVSRLGSYNPYASVAEESTTSHGPAATQSVLFSDVDTKPPIAMVDTGGTKEVTVGIIKASQTPVVSVAAQKPEGFTFPPKQGK